jgi:hypothetical protein
VSALIIFCESISERESDTFGGVQFSSFIFVFVWAIFGFWVVRLCLLVLIYVEQAASCDIPLVVIRVSK